MIGDGLGVAAKEIGVDVERAGHSRRRGQSEISLSVLQVEIAGQNGLPIPDNVDIRRAVSACGEHLERNAITRFDDGAAGAQKNLIGSVPRLQRNVSGGVAATMVIGLHAKSSSA